MRGLGGEERDERFLRYSLVSSNVFFSAILLIISLNASLPSPTRISSHPHSQIRRWERKTHLKVLTPFKISRLRALLLSGPIPSYTTSTLNKLTDGSTREWTTTHVIRSRIIRVFPDDPYDPVSFEWGVADKR